MLKTFFCVVLSLSTGSFACPGRFELSNIEKLPVTPSGQKRSSLTNTCLLFSLYSRPSPTTREQSSQAPTVLLLCKRSSSSSFAFLKRICRLCRSISPALNLSFNSVAASEQFILCADVISALFPSFRIPIRFYCIFTLNLSLENRALPYRSCNVSHIHNLLLSIFSTFLNPHQP